MHIRKGLFLLLCSLSTVGLRGQPALDTLHFSRQHAEALFLQQNLQLLAAKLDIGRAEAQVIQARLWPNPTLSVGEINLWTNAGAEELGSLTGHWGNTAQVAVEVEQLIRTAAKRRKELEKEQVGVAQAQTNFENVLRNLKLEFRNRLSELEFTQQQSQVYQRELHHFQQLLHAYGRGVEAGHASPGSYLRLQAFEIALLQSINAVKEENLHAQRAVKALMGIAAPYEVKLIDEPSPLPFPVDSLRNLDIGTLISLAQESHPELKAAELEMVYADKWLAAERAQRVPDVAVAINYDRGGNIMRDFVGLNVSMELPLFNRNQGHIKVARIAQEQGEINLQQKRNETTNSIVQAWQELLITLDYYEKLASGFEERIDAMLAAYHRSFANDDISLLEYLDFLETYLSNKTATMETRKQVQQRYEALNYAIGRQVAAIPAK